jgi:hypothetical protein
MYLNTILPRKSIFEFALRARKITILGALATQFHEICGLGCRVLRVLLFLLQEFVDERPCIYVSVPDLRDTL